LKRFPLPFPRHGHRLAALWGLLVLAGLILGATPTWAARSAWTEQSGTFTAYWDLSGTVHLLEFMGGDRIAAGRLVGVVNIKTDQGTFRGFETDCVAFADPATGSLGRCVWTGPMGDVIYVEMKGSGTGGFRPTQGTFVGGTGKYEGIEGGFAFEWNYSLSGGDEATLDGYTLEMNGRYRKP
jgi:hypothetical protein